MKPLMDLFPVDFMLAPLGASLLRLTNLVLVVLLGWLTAQLLWLSLVGPGHTVRLASAGISDRSSAVALDYSVLERVSPFRQTVIAPTPQLAADEDAPATALDLTFYGARMESGDQSVAFISVGQGPQQRFGIGDPIGNQQAVIERIYSDGVILRRQGRLEALRSDTDRAIISIGGQRPATSIDGAELSEPEADTPSPVTPEPESEQPSAPVEMATASLARADILELAGSIRFESVEMGSETGFRVFPTRRSGLLAAAGLQPGDVIISVSGANIQAYQDLQAALAELDRRDSLELGLLRGGDRWQVTIDIDSVEN